MKAPDFRYECPANLQQALELKADTDTDYQPLAGGQSLMPMMQLRLAQPEVLLDLNQLSELEFIRQSGVMVEIGSMVRYSDLLDSELVSKVAPLITRALPYIAHSAIRNRGTIGGSIALADPAAEMPALMIALGAEIVCVSTRGKRAVAAEDFFLGLYETALADDELVQSVQFPVATATEKFGFYELARRHGDYAMAGVAIRAGMAGPLDDLRIVFFSFSDRAIRATAAEAVLTGASLNDQAMVDKAIKTLADIEALADLNASSKTKIHLAGVVMKRALLEMRSSGT